MIFYEILGSRGQEWNAVEVAAYVTGIQVGAGSWYGVAGDEMYGASGGGRTAGGGWYVSCWDVTPGWRIIRQVGGGSAGGRDWWVWRLAGWTEPVEILTESERVYLEGRRLWCIGVIHTWERERAEHPQDRARDISATRAELATIEQRLRGPGSYYIMGYIGYGRHVGPGRYLIGQA